jgi:predicted dehydrogenase
MSSLRVAIVGCGLIGAKRAAALVAAGDRLLACYDVDPHATQRLAGRYHCQACTTVDELLRSQPEVVIVATIHSRLAELTERALAAGMHVLVEKPAGLSASQIDRLIECQRASGRLVKVGFNHRFHEGVARAVEEVHSGRHGELMYLRARYGHRGRSGYGGEWRTDPMRSGGGELIDQGMHLLDLSHWLAGPLPLHSALMRTQFWDTTVEDNAALILGEVNLRSAPWAMLHVSWTEWKNLFSLEIFCREAKIQVNGLGRSYGSQCLKLYRVRQQPGYVDEETIAYLDEDLSWLREWRHFACAVKAEDGRPLLGDLQDARYAWSQIEAAYAAGPYSAMRDEITGALHESGRPAAMPVELNS